MVPVDYLFRKNDSHCCVHYYCVSKMPVGKMFFDGKTQTIFYSKDVRKEKHLTNKLNVNQPSGI
jgi:hypothetical protein